MTGITATKRCAPAASVVPCNLTGYGEWSYIGLAERHIRSVTLVDVQGNVTGGGAGESDHEATALKTFKSRT
jgi:hypothetical protein